MPRLHERLFDCSNKQERADRPRLQREEVGDEECLASSCGRLPYSLDDLNGFHAGQELQLEERAIEPVRTGEESRAVQGGHYNSGERPVGPDRNRDGQERVAQIQKQVRVKDAKQRREES